MGHCGKAKLFKVLNIDLLLLLCIYHKTASKIGSVFILSDVIVLPFLFWIFTTPLLPSTFGLSLLLGVILGVFFMVYSTRWLSRPRMWELLHVPDSSEGLGAFRALCS